MSLHSTEIYERTFMVRDLEYVMSELHIDEYIHSMELLITKEELWEHWGGPRELAYPHLKALELLWRHKEEWLLWQKNKRHKLDNKLYLADTSLDIESLCLPPLGHVLHPFGMSMNVKLPATIQIESDLLHQISKGNGELVFKYQIDRRVVREHFN